MGLYASDGSINVTVVDGNSYVGAQAADGSLNVLVVDGSDYTGLLAGCGAVNVIAAVADSNSYFHPCGAWYVSESPYSIGAVRVTVVSGSIGGAAPQSVVPVGLLLAITMPTTPSAFTPMGDEEFLLLL